MKYDYIILPSKPRVISETGNEGVFEIDGLHPGYGVTIGNSLRRVLLSSLPGAAVTSVNIKGVQHEFSTIPGILEDMVSVLLNIKRLRFIMNAEEPQIITLSSKGVKELRAKDLKLPSTIEVVNGDSLIATITDKNTEIEMEMIVEKGLGYVPREQARKEKVDVGMMTLDAFFSPMRKVNYEVENMRVGDRTDYNRIRFHLETDGSITPREALQRAVEITVEQFTALAGGFLEGTDTDKEPEMSSGPTLEEENMDSEISGEEADLSKLKIEDLRLPSRTINALHEHGIKTVGGLLRKDAESLSEIPGVGEKAIQEIKRALGSMGLTLK